MRLTDPSGEEWRAHFHHARSERSSTSCALHKGPCEATTPAECAKTTFGRARVVCYAETPFVKREGRKQALARAMGVIGLDRDYRTALWQSYLRISPPQPNRSKRCPPPRRARRCTRSKKRPRI